MFLRFLRELRCSISRVRCPGSPVQALRELASRGLPQNRGRCRTSSSAPPATSITARRRWSAAHRRSTPIGSTRRRSAASPSISASRRLGSTPADGTSASSTCPATSASSRTCWRASAASTLVLLVIAADEAVMPQTREHLRRSAPAAPHHARDRRCSRRSTCRRAPTGSSWRHAKCAHCSRARSSPALRSCRRSATDRRGPRGAARAELDRQLASCR